MIDRWFVAKMLGVVLASVMTLSVFIPAIIGLMDASNVQSAMSFLRSAGYTVYGGAPGGDWNPTADNTYTLGTPSLRWATGSIVSLTSPIGRAATYVIAASDAPANWKAQANAVCGGVDDSTVLQAADIAGYLVQLSPGKFVTTHLVVIQNAHFKGCGASQTIVEGGDGTGIIQIHNNGNITDLLIQAGPGYAGSGVLVAGQNMRIGGKTGLLDNVSFVCPTLTGNAISSVLSVSGGPDAYVALCSFGDIAIWGFDRGVNVSVAGIGHNAWFNGNVFSSLVCSFTGTSLRMTTTGTVDMMGNVVRNMQVQPGLAGTNYAVYFDGDVELNTVSGLFPWDWGMAAEVSVYLGAATSHNYIMGWIPSELDLGAGNTLVNIG